MIFPLVQKLGAMRRIRGQESPPHRREVHAQPGAPVASCSVDDCSGSLRRRKLPPLPPSNLLSFQADRLEDDERLLAALDG